MFLIWEKPGYENFQNTATVSAIIKANKSVKSIKKGEDDDSDSNYFEARYEGYGPEGTAIIVEALTNNKNRTASEIRTTFSKNGGTLGEAGSVSHNFTRLGNIIMDKNIGKETDIFNFAIECGSIDFETNEDNFSIFCNVKDYHNLVHKFTNYKISIHLYILNVVSLYVLMMCFEVCISKFEFVIVML